MHLVAEPDGGVAACPGEHDWEEIRQDGIYWRSCKNCTKTECTAPGLDRCCHLGMEETPRAEYLQMTRFERAVQIMMGSDCDRLTTNRCPVCKLGICSDHVAMHSDWCGHE